MTTTAPGRVLIEMPRVVPAIAVGSAEIRAITSPLTGRGSRPRASAKAIFRREPGRIAEGAPAANRSLAAFAWASGRVSGLLGGPLGGGDFFLHAVDQLFERSAPDAPVRRPCSARRRALCSTSAMRPCRALDQGGEPLLLRGRAPRLRGRARRRSVAMASSGATSSARSVARISVSARSSGTTAPSSDRGPHRFQHVLGAHQHGRRRPAAHALQGRENLDDDAAPALERAPDRRLAGCQRSASRSSMRRDALLGRRGRAPAVSIRAVLSLARSARIAAISASSLRSALRRCSAMRVLERLAGRLRALASRPLCRSRAAIRPASAGCRASPAPAEPRPRARCDKPRRAPRRAARREDGTRVHALRNRHSAAMIGVSGEDRQGPIELLGDKHAHDLVRHGQRAEGQRPASARCRTLSDRAHRRRRSRRRRPPPAVIAPAAEPSGEGLARRALAALVEARSAARGAGFDENGGSLLAPGARHRARGAAFRNFDEIEARSGRGCARAPAIALAVALDELPLRAVLETADGQRGSDAQAASARRQLTRALAAGRRPTSSRDCRTRAPRDGRHGSMTSPASISTQSQAGMPSTLGVREARFP